LGCRFKASVLQGALGQTPRGCEGGPRERAPPLGICAFMSCSIYIVHCMLLFHYRKSVAPPGEGGTGTGRLAPRLLLLLAAAPS
jgi:hypothetical protein